MKHPFLFSALLFFLAPDQQLAAQTNSNWVTASTSEARQLALDESKCCALKKAQNYQRPLGTAARFDQWDNYLKNHLVYPERAQTNGIEGVVVIETLIGADGDVQSVGLVKGIGFGCDQAVMELVSNMPDWTPAEENGQKVAQKAFIRVNFQLR